MIKISLTRDEIETAIVEYAEKNILSYGLMAENTIKVSQGKSANATILVVPKSTSNEDIKDAVSEADKEIEIIAGQPDVEPDEHPSQMKMFE